MNATAIKEREEAIRALAARQGIEDADEVSEGEDNGAYVRTWAWVSFAGTALDKETAEQE